jgi:hypothetical protein
MSEKEIKDCDEWFLIFKCPYCHNYILRRQELLLKKGYGVYIICDNCSKTFRLGKTIVVEKVRENVRGNIGNIDGNYEKPILMANSTLRVDGNYNRGDR